MARRFPPRTPLLVGLLVVAFGWSWAAVGGIPFQGDELRPCGKAINETESWQSRVALWPPGAQACRIERRDGRVEHATDVPWRAWGGVLLLGVAAAALTAALRGPLRRSVLLVAGALLAWLASVAVVFELV